MIGGASSFIVETTLGAMRDALEEEHLANVTGLQMLCQSKLVITVGSRSLPLLLLLTRLENCFGEAW